jgi:hypothetical protein
MNLELVNRRTGHLRQEDYTWVLLQKRPEVIYDCSISLEGCGAMVDLAVFQKVIEEALEWNIFLQEAELLTSGFDLKILEDKLCSFFGSTDSFADPAAVDPKVNVPILSAFVDVAHPRFPWSQSGHKHSQGEDTNN